MSSNTNEISDESERPDEDEVLRLWREQYGDMIPERIVDTKIGEDGRRYYKVQWAASTMEPAKNFLEAELLIKKYWDPVEKKLKLPSKKRKEGNSSHDSDGNEGASLSMKGHSSQELVDQSHESVTPDANNPEEQPTTQENATTYIHTESLLSKDSNAQKVVISEKLEHTNSTSCKNKYENSSTDKTNQENHTETLSKNIIQKSSVKKHVESTCSVSLQEADKEDEQRLAVRNKRKISEADIENEEETIDNIKKPKTDTWSYQE